MDFHARIAEAFAGSPAVEFTTPRSDANLHATISRWSDIDVDIPALIIVPTNEDDILKAIRIAKTEKLKLIPASGTHGSFVPIGGKTLYLNMKKFDTVSLDQASGTVTVGGGVDTRQLVQVLSDHGYYTNFPNSNGVGIVGAVLGGGSGSLNGQRGLMIDNVHSIRLITASGEIIETNEDTTPPNASLFNACCGAGHGLGVVTSLSLRAYPLDDLRMNENKVWVRKMLFSPSELASATELYTNLLPPPPLMLPVLLFARAPPSAPKPGTPMVLLTICYFGASVEAEEAAVLSSSPKFTEKR